VQYIYCALKALKNSDNTPFQPELLFLRNSRSNVDIPISKVL